MGRLQNKNSDGMQASANAPAETKTGVTLEALKLIGVENEKIASRSLARFQWRLISSRI